MNIYIYIYISHSHIRLYMCKYVAGGSIWTLVLKASGCTKCRSSDVRVYACIYVCVCKSFESTLLPLYMGLRYINTYIICGYVRSLAMLVNACAQCVCSKVSLNPHKS